MSPLKEEVNIHKYIFELRHEKISLRSFRPGPTQTGLYGHRRCTTTEDDRRLEISDLESRGIVLSKQRCYCPAIAQLICIFVFAYAKSSFSHDAAHFMSTP